MQPFGYFCAAFPNREYFPAKLAQLAGVALISRSITASLRLPELGVRGRNHSPIAAGVHVEEATVNEDGDLASRYHNVRPSRQIVSM